MNLEYSDKGIEFDASVHQYRNSKGERYVSGTQFISFFKPKFESDFWLEFKCYENLFNNILCNNEQINEMNSYRRKAGWRDLSKQKASGLTLWKLLKTRKMVGISNKELLNSCASLLVQNNLFIDLEEGKKALSLEWEEKSNKALKRGNEFHDGEEDRIRKENNFTHDWNNIDLSYPNLTAKTYPELRLYNHDAKLAGSADKIIIKNKNGDFHLLDYKTNQIEKFRFEGFTNPYTKKTDMMLDPISELENCEFIHYTLQLSLYSWMLEELGYNHTKCTIEHITFSEKLKDNGKPYTTVNPYDTLYMKKAILRMVEYYKDNNLYPY